MPGLTAGLNIGLSGLSAAQSALDIIGHNIANINTPGYSREQAQLATNHSLDYGNLVYGTGVNLNAIQAVRDSLLNLQITQSTSLQYGAQTRYQGLQTVSSVFQDDGTTGISSQVNAFFTALQKVAAQPEDVSLRTNLVGTAQNLLTTLQTKYNALRGAQNSANQSVDSLVPQVNVLTAQIASLNKKLSGEANSTSDNEIMDQRQALADQLAQIVGVQTYVDSKNQMNISLEGGTSPLVVGSTSFVLTAAQNTNPPATAPFYDSVLSSPNGSGPFTDITASIKSGQLGAQIDLRDNLIPSYEKQMDQLAAGLAYNVNTLSSAGASLDGNQHNLDFFVGGAGNTAHLPTGIQVPPGGASAANDYKGMVLALSVNAAIVANPSLFAAAGPGGAAGDNSNATAMVALQTSVSSVDVAGLGPAAGATGPFSSFITGLVTKVGTDANQWNTTATNQENITTALTTQRTSVSGVDLDTEAGNLITFQRGYQASARFVSVISQLTDQLVNTLGK